MPCANMDKGAGMGSKRCLAIIVALLLLVCGRTSAFAQDVGSTPVGPERACASVKATNFSKLQDAPTGIISAQLVEFQPWNLKYGPKNIEVCQVEGFVTLTISFKIILPTHGWNGKYLQGGCGGACGTTKLFWCDVPLRRGYACLGSDMGHVGTVADWRFAQNNEQLQGDFGYRSTHVAAIVGKAVVAAYYGKSPRLSYY